ncbi:glycosyl transferase family 41-domain-containing protein [Podospora australis]|uniref:protein O-GlcNAc transferase n=1 Tax=Podospora australis TaxID=1536484 RepID=A0AAN7AM11_9PEZI|nr:glycosyl transferase family 41-domain-containing protein [Podospora australis]
MLPLVQMHPMVQPQLDLLGPRPAHVEHDLEYMSHQQRPQSHFTRPNFQNTDSTPRAFAIRTGNAQPAPSLHRITTTFLRSHTHDPNNNEYSLRRKTPNGTIDNGYDGSVAHLASGPPPLKHMIVPGSSRIFPTPTAASQRIPAPSGANVHRPSLSGPSWSYPSATPTGRMDLGGVEPLSSPSAASGGGPWGNVMLNPVAPADHTSFLQPLPHHSYHHSASSLQPLLGPSYQQSMSQAVYSPGGYQHQQQQQSAAWRNGGYSDYRSPVPLANGYTPQNAVVDGAFMPSQSTIHGLPNAPGLGQAQAFRLQPLDDGYARYAQNHPIQHPPGQGPESLSQLAVHVARGTGGDISSRARFKELALQQAHKAYNDLLFYLSTVKRPHHTRTGSNPITSSSKMVVFPKPSIGTSAGSSMIRSPPMFAEPAASYAQHLAQKEAIARGSGLHGFNRDPYTQRIQHRPVFSMGSPFQGAKSSLEIITNLCEQSGWKWIDGMLLGGCLHYGLERYDEALEWFRRIVNLDASHVEAISNIAATLYCLNKQDEAEQQWVKAIRLRPSYLEAVEHLVGLMCSNHRNQDAVHTIDYIQRTLRMPGSFVAPDQASETASEADAASSTAMRETKSPDSFAFDSDKTDSPEQRFAKANENSSAPGFGSSGYAIPGNENGRMVLLIHAKGNMLYALKSIELASQAFEEAVLISAGRQVQGVQSLIRRIQTVLSPNYTQSGLPRGSGRVNLAAPLLLSPARAKNTAQLVFSSNGGILPGLQYVAEGAHKKSAVSTTSNSLLSLAKIFQDAMSNGGLNTGLIRHPAGVGDILALYYLSLSLQESPSTANNVGILLASVQQTAMQTPSGPTPDMGIVASIPGIVPGSGLALALQYYYYGLTLDPKHVHLHTNLGSLLKDIGQLDMAIQMYEQAVACDGTFDIALTNLANAVKDRGRISDAINYYKRAVAANPDFAEAVCGLSTALNSVCDWKGRGGVLLEGGRYDRWHVDELGMLKDAKTQTQGSGLMRRVVEIVARQLKESRSWGRGALQEQSIMQLVAQLRDAGAGLTDPNIDLAAELRNWAGKSWEGSRIVRLVERSTRAAMRCRYIDKYVKGVSSGPSYRRPRPPVTLSVPSAPTVLPFHTFTCPLTAKDIRMISQRNALRISSSALRSPWIPTTVYEPPHPPAPYFKVGYVSSDFNNHPLAHLMQSVFGFHDPNRVRAYCYATTASDKSIHRAQIEREAPVFRDVSTWPSDKLVDQIVADGIHILVNLNGYTRGARNEIFAARPAPIQMSFMGFAGTLGAEWCDYLLADTTAIPPSTLRPHRNNLNLEDVFRDEAYAESEDWIYSENIIFSRDTFFCCDHAQSADGHKERNMTWEEDQRRRWKMRKELFPKLPDDAIILGNFNQLYKIDPTTFRSWLRILAHAPNTYLWLLRFPELGETHLRRTAREWAGEGVANRIIFTDVAPKQQHISRARVCDLFLDTPECNAHTTAADILWSSTPLLTLPRYDYKMCSRMAASILKGALPKSEEGRLAATELIAVDETEYENFALTLVCRMRYRLVQGPNGETYGEGVGRLADLRKLLWESKWSCALFDTRRWVRDLEDAYTEAWKRWVDGVGGDIYL